jgi:propanol-preferring alcohol dehydrogenase
MHSACLSCKHCKQGRENICVKMESVGRSVDGGYAEYGRFDSRFLTKVPRKIDPLQAAPLFCAGLTACRAVKRIAPKKDENVAVVGIGGLGGYAIQFAKMAGANVYAFSRGEERLKLAKKLGAKQAIDSTEGLAKKMADIGIEAALVFAPSAHVLEQALTGVEKGGRILMGGNIERTNEMDYRKALAYEKTITTVSVGTRQDMRELINLAAKGKVRSQVSDVPLEEANEALADVKSGAVAGRIVLSCSK